MTRALGRGKVKDLGETLDSGVMAIIVVSPPDATNGICHTLKGSTTTTTVPSADSAEIQQALNG
jgi:hypothetical protein